jgi:hypothetical protein
VEFKEEEQEETKVKGTDGMQEESARVAARVQSFANAETSLNELM